MTNPTTTATDTTAKSLRRRGIIELPEQILDRILDLPDGQRIIGFREDPMRMLIEVGIEGDGLPECAPGCYPYVVNAEPYTAKFSRWAMRGRDLEEIVELVAARLESLADPEATAVGADLRRILDGTFDPRVQS